MANVTFQTVDLEESSVITEILFDTACDRKINLFGKPWEIGHYSIDADRKIHFDKREMKYLIFPPKTKNLNLNLNADFSVDVIHDYVIIEKMHQILYWLKHNSSELSKYNLKISDFDFISFRGALRRIFCTPYIDGYCEDKWVICASKYKGVIYLSAVDTDTDIEKLNNRSLKKLQMESWGYKFEQYMTSSEIDGKIDLSSRNHQLEEFCVILKNVLNNHVLLYGAEIDAVIPYRHSGPGMPSTSCYTELKTSKIFSSFEQKFNFWRYKSLNWWAQCHLSGIPEICCGFRSDDGVVKFIEALKTVNISQEAQFQGFWKSEICLNFCDSFLNLLKRTVVKDDPKIVYKFTYKSGNISCSRLDDPPSRYQVIPDWYTA